MKASEDQRARRGGWTLYFTINENGLAFIATFFLLSFPLIGAVRGAEDQTQPLDVRVAELFNQGKYQEAKTLAERLLSEAEKAASRRDANQTSNLVKLATTLSYLGQIDENLGDYSKAEALLRRALETRERLGGAEHVETIRAMIDLAGLYSETGDPQEGEPLLLRAEKLCKKAFGHEHELTALVLNNMGALYQKLGEYRKSELLYQQALDIRERLLGPENPTTVWVIENLASVYEKTGDYPKAISLTRRALAAYESATEPDPLGIADSMTALAFLYLHNSEHPDMLQKALGLLERAVEIRMEEQGPEHRDTARSFDDLSIGYMLADDFSKAAQFQERALKIAEKRLGPSHPDTAAHMNNLALVYIALGRHSDALKLARRSAEARTIHLKKILSFTSEEQRLAFVSEMRPLTQFGTLGSAPDVARTILRLKGIVLDSILEDRVITESSREPAQRGLVEKLRRAKQRLMELTLTVPKDGSTEALRAHQEERGTLEAETEELEKTLMRQIAGLGKTRRALEVTVEEVQRSLQPKAALVEYLVYDHFVGRSTLEWRYGAVVICRDRAPQWIPLSTKSLIDRKISLYQKAARAETNAETLKTALAGLYKHVWADVEKALPADTETVVISPDGELNFLSFATLLLPDDRFLAEKYSLRYVASGRDLLRKLEPSAEPRMTILANPDFVARPEGNIENSPKRKPEVSPAFVKRDVETLELPPLPGTAAESRALEAQARNAGWQTEIYLGKEATESELRKVQSRRILHLATHGFFLQMEAAQAQENKEQRGIGGMRPSVEPALPTIAGSIGNAPKHVVLENPMLRSGLALAGAQTTLQAWSRGEVPPTENDGIINALEVGGLNLKNTWLVTLSACDTGVGEAAAGEGVMGLRRGFIEAGAQNLLMTLWSVADEETAKLMVDFYKAAQSGNNAPKALADVQREWMVRLRAERGLQAAITIAGPFIMNSQGPVR